MGERKHFRFLMYLMIFSGTWRLELETTSKRLRKIYEIYTVIIQSIFVCFLGRLLIKLALVWNVDKNATMENLGVTIFCVIMFIKLMICQSNGIKDLLRRILRDEEVLLNSGREDDKRIYKDYAEYTLKITAAIAIYTYLVAGLPMIFLNYISYLEWEERHITMNTTEPKPHLMVTWYPFDMDKHYFWAFGIESVSILISSTVNTVTQTFFITMMCFMIGRLIILQQHFRNFESNQEGENVQWLVDDERRILKTLRGFVLEHLEIIGFIENLDKYMRLMMLLEFLMNSLQIASLLIQLLTNGPSQSVPRSAPTLFYLGLVTTQLFLLAWNANEIKEQSAALSNSLYDSSWYEHGISVKKYILLMMVRSQRPLTLQIGPFYPMTINTAIATMKAAYSYVTILR